MHFPAVCNRLHYSSLPVATLPSTVNEEYVSEQGNVDRGACDVARKGILVEEHGAVVLGDHLCWIVGKIQRVCHHPRSMSSLARTSRSWSTRIVKPLAGRPIV